MPKLVSDKAYLPFTKGLITEVSPLAYPEGATLDEDNIIITRAGERERRLGLKVDSDSVWVQPVASYGTCTEPTGNCTSVSLVTYPGCYLESGLACNTNIYKFSFDSAVKEDCHNIGLSNTGTPVISNTQVLIGSNSLYLDGSSFITLNSALSATASDNWEVYFSYYHTGQGSNAKLLLGVYSGAITIFSVGYGTSPFVILSRESRNIADSVAVVASPSTDGEWHTVKYWNSPTDNKVYACFDGTEYTAYSTALALNIKYFGYEDASNYRLTGYIDDVWINLNA
jgi:hypothetical protein